MSEGSGALRPPPARVFSVMVGLVFGLPGLTRLPGLSRLIGPIELDAIGDPAFVVWPSIVGAVAYDAFQLAAAVAGRGRAPPGATLAVPLRAVVTVGFALLWRGRLGDPSLASVFAVFGLFAATEVLARRGAPSPTLIAFVPFASAGLLSHLLRPPPDWRISWLSGLITWAIDLGALAAIWLVLRRLGLGREELASVGVQPRSPAELGLIAAAGHIVGGAFGFLLGAGDRVLLELVPAAAAAGTTLVLLALVYLARLRRSRDARRPTPRGTAAPPA